MQSCKFQEILIVTLFYSLLRFAITPLHVMIEDESSEFFPANDYTVYRKDRPPSNNNQSYGGVLIAISTQLLSNEIRELQTDSESIWAEINMTNARKLILGCYYRPPSDNGISLENLNTSLNRINNNTKTTVMLGGDFNLGHIDWEIPCIIPGKPEIKLHTQLLDIINDHSLEQIVNKPTRGDRILDLLFTNTPSIVNKTETMPPIGNADHDIVYSECNVSLKRNKKQPIKVLQYTKADWSKMKIDLGTLLCKIKEQFKESTSNILWNTFTEALTQSVEANIPHKIVTNKKKLPWVNNKLKIDINKAKRLHKKSRKNEQLKKKYKHLKKSIQTDMRRSYWNYIENMIFDLPVNEPDNNIIKRQPKNLYSYIKNMKNDSSGIAALRKDGILTDNTEEKANLLNNQFQKAFSTETSSETIPDMGISNHPKMNTIQISEKGILKLLEKINPHKATGPDGIYGRVLKELSTDIAPIITLIFEKSLNTGKIPTDWKHANVCPVFKKGDKHNPINYRPISLTCILCKIMEHILASNIMAHLENNNILYDLQHGFRSSRSCETQLVSFIQELAKHSNDNIQTDVIVMDFAKAFDKVPHKRLLHKLKHYGVDNKTLNWIEDFLSLRTQTVLLEGTKSEQIHVTSGVPQGTVLGPILFLVYINDLNDYIKHGTLRLFADDSIIYKTIKNKHDSEKLQEDLTAAAKWEEDWLMSFHPDKCSVLQVTTKKTPLPYDYILHGHTLQQETSTKYLGLTIQTDLKFNKHINNITANATKQLNFIKRNLKVSSQSVKEKAYISLVRPKLEYGSCIWDPHTKSQKSQIEMVQRRAARYICNRYHNTSSVTNMLNHLNWPTLELRRIRTRLIFFFKIIHHQVAIYPTNLLIPSDSRTRQYTHSHSFRHIQAKKDSYKFSFYPRTIIQWNLLPVTAVQCTTVEAFREQIPTSVLNQYYTIVYSFLLINFYMMVLSVTITSEQVYDFGQMEDKKMRVRDKFSMARKENPKTLIHLKEDSVPTKEIYRQKSLIYNPKHVAFNDKESRKATFDGWRTDIEQTPEILADAGFFFPGEADLVRCHYCGGGFRNWGPGDIPWEEHARCYPFCKFVIKMKGREYIDDVKRRTEERQRAATPSENLSAHNNANYNVHHPAITKLESYGLPEADISSAAREYLRRNGYSNFNEDEQKTIIYDKENHHQQNQRKPFSGQNVFTVDTPAERDPEKLIETNRKLKEKLKCVRCRTNDICMLFVNCGHRLTCETCAYKMDFCPHCDTRVKKKLKTYLS